MDRDYYVAELREAERLTYRAQCWVRCLEANLDRIAPEDFEPLMESLEAARREGVDGIVLNAGALTHTSLALADCLAWIGIPCVEVHISNVFARTDQPLRRQSLIGGQVIGVIAGFGLTGYALAVAALLQRRA